MHQPTTTHFTALKRILRYLKGTLFHGILIKKKGGGSLALTTYSDANWAGDPLDRRSATGYLLCLPWTSLISWCAKKQSTIVHSSTKAEDHSLAHTAVELSLLWTLFKDLRIFLLTCPLIWCDNVSIISLSSNPVFHARMKHAKVDYHFIREKVLSKYLVVRCISTQDQIADIFTKKSSFKTLPVSQIQVAGYHFSYQLEGGC